MSERDPVKLIASIMQKAQHRSAADINEPIEIGEECWLLRRFVDLAAERERELRDELAQKDARIARLESLLEGGVAECEHVCIAGSLDNLEEGRKRVIAWVEKAEKARNEHPRQSAAAIKAEALHRVRSKVRSDMQGEGICAAIDDEIDRMERGVLSGSEGNR